MDQLKLKATEAKQRVLANKLTDLEAEAIFILREVAAEFANPVMLYSVGKDSSVLLHLALKAFYPEKPPFPLLHRVPSRDCEQAWAEADCTHERRGAAPSDRSLCCGRFGLHASHEDRGIEAGARRA
jgi:hypothetical protein